jgi:hypothetical protein
MANLRKEYEAEMKGIKNELDSLFAEQESLSSRLSEVNNAIIKAQNRSYWAKKHFEDAGRRMYFATELLIKGGAAIKVPRLPLEVMQIIFFHVLNHDGRRETPEPELYNFYPKSTQAAISLRELGPALHGRQPRWIAPLLQVALRWNANRRMRSVDGIPSWETIPIRASSLKEALDHVGPIELRLGAATVTLFSKHLLEVACPVGTLNQCKQCRGAYGPAKLRQFSLFRGCASQSVEEGKDSFYVPYTPVDFCGCPFQVHPFERCTKCKPVFLLNPRSKSLSVCLP